jgi:anti-anti-sigma factor
MGNQQFALAVVCVIAWNEAPTYKRQPCQVRHINGLPAISLPAEVDTLNVGLLRDAVFQVCLENPPVVIVDMTKNTYIDAGTIGVLLPLAKRLRDSGAELRLLLGSARVPRRLVLEVFPLNQFSRIVETMAEALANDRQDPMQDPTRYVPAA